MDRVPPDQIRLRLVETLDDLNDFREWSLNIRGDYVACDTETTGLQPWGHKPDRLRLVQFGNENEGWAIPVERRPENRAAVQEALERFAGRLVGHNSRFDESFLRAEGFVVGGQWDDTYIAHHLLYPLDYHGLKPAAGQLYGREVRAGEKWLDTVKRKNGWDWATVPVDHPAYWGYSALDTVLTCRLAFDLLPQALAKFGEQYEREVRVAAMMSRLSERGLLIDTEYCERLTAKWGTEITDLRARLDAYSIENPGSTAQIAAALQNDGWEPDVFTETGKPSVNRAVLEGMDHEIADLVLRWRRLTKWSKAYLDPMLACGGRLHPNISSLRAATGRMAISDPPLQQLPRGPEVRSAVLADDGTEFWSVDFTGQEMRLAAAFANDPEFTNSVLNGDDIHGRVAAELFGPGYTKEQRSWCKNGIYAYSYGAQPGRMAATTHSKMGRAEKAIKKAFPGLVALQEDIAAKAAARLEDDGMAWARTAGGRVVAVPRSKKYALSNYLMQGSGADLMKEALIRIDDAGLSGTLRLVIHDEVLACLPPGEEGREQAEEIRKLMESDFRGVPFDCDASGPGRNWGEAK